MNRWLMGVSLFTRASLLGLLALPVVIAMEAPRQVNAEDELQERWRSYWQDRFGGFADDHGEIDAAEVAERVVDDLERLVDLELASYAMPRVAARLHDYPEHLALDTQVREWIRILGKDFVDSGYLQSPYARMHQFLGAWNELSEWWFEMVGPSLPPEEFRDLLLESARMETDFPLSPLLSMVTFVLRDLIDDEDRDQLYQLLLDDGLRSNYLSGWSRVLHSPALRPRQEELAQLLTRDDPRYIHWTVRMFGRFFPEDIRGQEAALSLLQSSAHEDKISAIEPLHTYFRSDISNDRQQEMFDQYILLLEKDQRRASTQIEEFKTIRVIISHFIGFPQDVLRRREENIDRVIALFEWAEDLGMRRESWQNSVSMDSIEDLLKRFNELKESMVDADLEEGE